jgi:hypothetical protein
LEIIIKRNLEQKEIHGREIEGGKGEAVDIIAEHARGVPARAEAPHLRAGSLRTVAPAPPECVGNVVSQLGNSHGVEY